MGSRNANSIREHSILVCYLNKLGNLGHGMYNYATGEEISYTSEAED